MLILIYYIIIKVENGGLFYSILFPKILVKPKLVIVFNAINPQVIGINNCVNC